jgi:hypothetical protein
MPSPGFQRSMLSRVRTEQAATCAETSTTEMMACGSLAIARIAVADDDFLPQTDLRHQERCCKSSAFQDESLTHTLLTSFILG